MSTSVSPNRSPSSVLTETFYDWVREEMRLRHWNQGDFAKALGRDRSTVTKWLLPESSPNHRKPDYHSALIIARVLNADPDLVLAKIGLPPRDSGPESDIKRNVHALISHIPDHLLVPVYHQLRVLANEAIQQRIEAQLSSMDEAQDDATTHHPVEPE